MKNRILNGQYPAGEPLPKLGYLVAKEGLSPNTVSHAIKQLSSNNLVHKHGNRWYAGPAGPSVQVRVRERRRVALLIMASRHSFQEIFYTYYSQVQFFSAFESELVKHDIELCFAARQAAADDPPWVRSGIEETRKFVRANQDCYRGACIIDNAELSIEEQTRWISELAFREKPVAFFDFSDSFGHINRATPGCARTWYRMHFNERAAVDEALRHLAQSGHRRIGFPLFAPGAYDWADRRFAAAKRIAGQMDPPPDVVPAVHSEPFWTMEEHDFDKVASFYRNIGPLLQPAGPATKVRMRTADTLRKNAPSIAGLIDKGATAVMAMDDWMAFQYLLWFRTVGIDVPRGMSIVSFDNNPQGLVLPVDSVDFGFQRLGYLAAHALIGDFAVPADAAGNVPGICTVVKRGSVAAHESRRGLRR